MHRLVLLSLIAMMLAGCAALQTAARTLAEHDVVVRIAVAEYIRGDADTARNFIESAEDALAQLSGTPRVPVDRLQAEADRLIPWDRMRPYQREIASEVLGRIERRLLQSVEDGELPSDAVADLRSIIETARRTARRELALIAGG